MAAVKGMGGIFAFRKEDIPTAITPKYTSLVAGPIKGL
jgi:hypothetical protein